jgi:hypothetical protein
LQDGRGVGRANAAEAVDAAAWAARALVRPALAEAGKDVA